MADEVRKQISIFLPLSEWRAVREEAARNHIPITELCRRWMDSEIQKLMNRSAGTADRSAESAWTETYPSVKRRVASSQ